MNGSKYLAFAVTVFSDFVLCTGVHSKLDVNYDYVADGKDIVKYIGEIFNGINGRLFR